MLNDNIKLPTVGSSNWGPNLNSYLLNLKTRITTLENNLNKLKEEGLPSTAVGHAGSGFIDMPVINCNGKTIQINGRVYVGGDANRTFEINDSYTFSPASSKGYCYVYLLYSTTSGKFEVDSSIIFVNDYTKILLGNYNCEKGEFVPVLYSSLKTLGEHENDRMVNRRILMTNDLGESYIEISDTGEPKEISIQTTYDFYDDGVGYKVGGDPSSNSPWYASDCDRTSVTMNYQWGYQGSPYLADMSLAGPGEPLYTTEITTPSSGYKCYGFRVLVTIDKKILLQRASMAQCKDQLPDALLYRENWLYNLKFNNNLTNDEKTYSYNASDFVEILRFGYNVNDSTAQGEFAITSLSSENNSKSFTLVYSQGSGLSPQQNLGAHLERNSTILIGTGDEATVFTMNTNTGPGFRFSYDGPINIVDPYEQINLNKHYDKSEKRDSPLLFANTKVPYDEDPTKIIEKIELLYSVNENEDNGVVINNQQTEILGNFLQRCEDSEQGISQIASNPNCIQLSSKQCQISCITDLSSQTIQVPFNAWFNSKQNYKVYIDYYRTPDSDATLKISSIQGLRKDSDVSFWITDLPEVEYDPESSEYYVILTNNTTDNVYLTQFQIAFDSSEGQWASCNYVEFYQDKGSSIGNFSSHIQMDEGYTIRYTSDERAKYNINPITDSYLKVVQNTPIVDFYYKQNNSEKQVGLIAQTLQSNLDNNKHCFVSTIKDDVIEDKLVINETKLVYILWKAIQEQQEQIEKLKKKVQDLEN